MSDKTQNFSFHIEGMTCATCSKMAEKALNRVAGVAFASVNLATETAFVTAEANVTEQDLFHAVEQAGFKARKGIDKNIEEARHKRAKLNLILCLAVGLPFCCLMYLAEFAGLAVPYYNYIELFAASFCLFYCGRDSFKSAFIALAHLHTNMNTLIVISGFSAWATCLLPILAPSYNFHSFGASAVMVMMFNLLGHYIESGLRAKASRDLKNLLSLAPRTARVVAEDGEKLLPAEAVKVGNTICVKPGEVVPLDGKIIQGTSEFDESVITGESSPVQKSAGENVTGGSLNLTGEIHFTVTRQASETFIAQMTHLVEVAQGSKIPLQEMADRLTLVFVPFVLVVAILAFVAWRFLPATAQLATLYSGMFHLTPANGTSLELAIFSFIATLVIACPCALGLATPIAFITASGVATRAGLLIKNIASLQTVRNARYCVLDKTGTLTEGKPHVMSAVIKEEDKPIALAMERASNHPTAVAICDFLANSSLCMGLSDSREVAGQGVYATHNGDSYFLGKEQEGDLPEKISQFKNLYKNCTLSFLYKNENCIAAFATIDKLREDATMAIKDIKELGITPILATGDKEEVARFVAQRAGIAGVFAEQSPQGKLSLVQSLRSGDKKELVIMAGDGINDAPALKGADCSIAMGSGSQISQEASDLVILRGGVGNIVYFIKLARFTTKIIYENLFLALAYNTIAIPLAVCGALHPAAAEIAMAASSITVVANSLRILRLRK